MPNIAAHYVCAKLVASKLQINEPDFLKGNIYPDYVLKDMHYRVQGQRFLVPDFERFMKEEQIENRLFKLGFLSHLILDKLFLDDYVLNNIYDKIDSQIDIFEPDKIYQDYTNISKRLLDEYNLSLREIDEIMLPERSNIDFEKYKSNTEVIRKSKSENLNYMDLDTFTEFLESSSSKITAYIKKKNY